MLDVLGRKYGVYIYPAPIGGQAGQIQAVEVLCTEFVQKIGDFWYWGAAICQRGYMSVSNER